MKMQAEVLIVGGGVIGLTTAYYLARKGVDVIVLESGEPGREASWAGAGIIPPGNLALAATSYDRLRALSAEVFDSLSNELRDLTGIDNGYRRCGGIELESGIAPEVIALWRAEGLRFEKVPAGQISRLEPALSGETCGGYYFPDMAQVRNPRHLRALTDACCRLGVTIRNQCPVQELTRAGRRIRSAQTAAGSFEGRQFLVAAGAWTDSILHPLGLHTGVKPIRGQIVLFRSPVPLLRTMLIDGPNYLVPRDDGRILAGSTEEDTGFVKENTALAVAGLTEFAIRHVPRLREAAIETTWAGLRPGSHDGLPTIGPAGEWENLYLATGHFRAGIQLSPATGQVLSQLLMGERPVIDLGDFRLARPVGPPPTFAFHS